MSLARAKQRVFGTGVTCNSISSVSILQEIDRLDKAEIPAVTVHSNDGVLKVNRPSDDGKMRAAALPRG